MAYVTMVDNPEVTSVLYDKSAVMMDLVGRLPEGCLAHIAGPGPHGWRVVGVWESLEKAQQFVTTMLRPVQAELGIAPPTKPPVIWELYDLQVESRPIPNFAHDRS